MLTLFCGDRGEIGYTQKGFITKEKKSTKIYASKLIGNGDNYFLSLSLKTSKSVFQKDYNSKITSDCSTELKWKSPQKLIRRLFFCGPTWNLPTNIGASTYCPDICRESQLTLNLTSNFIFISGYRERSFKYFFDFIFFI